MKLAAVAVAAVALFGVAIAQTGTPPAAAPAAPAQPSAAFAACPPLPADPAAWPDGATARPKDMEAAQKRYNEWEASLAPVITCKRAAQQDAKAIAEATTLAFNADAVRVNNFRNAWKTQAEAFMARSAKGEKK
ncbi:MAG: hypothetical protein NW200_11665 [Hyphomonadaceae bacterium]|nr:hypothetical protein [Hyphomonadaceae bacterium]